MSKSPWPELELFEWEDERQNWVVFIVLAHENSLQGGLLIVLICIDEAKIHNHWFYMVCSEDTKEDGKEEEEEEEEEQEEEKGVDPSCWKA